MSLAQGNNTPTRSRIEPGSPDPESDALTTWPVRSPRISLCKNAKKKSGGGPGPVGGWGLGRCEQIIEVIVKMQKKSRGGGGSGSGRGVRSAA